MRKNVRTQTSFSEAAATKHLNWLFYQGCGSKHLGFDFGTTELLPDGSWRQTKGPGPRVWSTPTDLGERIRWSPVWDHLKGCHRGVCRGQGEKCVPFVTADLDRHDGRIHAKDHYDAVTKAGRLLKRHFGFLSWLVEVNPWNGSTKFFGFTGNPIPIDYANKLGQQIHEMLIANGFGKREVFPHNSPQVFLPFREGKITIIDTGVLPMCERRRKTSEGKRVPFQTYSMIAFVEWLRRGRSFDERTLEKVLITACLQLPDEEPITVAKFATIPSSPTKTPVRAISTPANLRNVPDSFIRQRDGLLEFCRRNRRVVSVDEGLDFIKTNNLFTGSWSHNSAKRRIRVRQILPFIAKKFDSSLCTGVRHEINFGKFNDWAKQHCPDGWRRGAASRGLDQFGNLIVRQRDRTVADWHFVSVFLSIAEYVVANDKNSDDSVPTARAEALWTLLFDQGVIQVPFCPRKWKITRDRLEKMGVLRIDHHYHRGQAMKWWLGIDFPGLWKKLKKKAKGLLEPVSLVQFLLGQRETIEHNSLLQHAIEENDDSALFSRFWGSGADPPMLQQLVSQSQGWNEAGIN